MPAINPAKGSMPVLQFCLPSQLAVDPLYQRSIDAQSSRGLINRLARDWDWGLYQPLVVAQRPGGKLYVIDGQHRLEAARQRGDIPQLPCVVAVYTDPREEAVAFVALNDQRRPLSKLAIFRAALAADDADAMAIDRLIAGAGLRLTTAADRNVWKPGWVNNIVGIQQSFRQHGEKVTRIALEAMARAFHGQVIRHCGTLYTMIVASVVERRDDLPTALLVDLLQEHDGDEWIALARDRASADGVSVPVAARRVLANAVTEAMAQ